MAYTRVTLADLDARLQERCGNNSTWWVVEERTDAINEAISCWQAMIGNWETTFPLTADGGVFYTVPKQLTSLQRVSHQGVPLVLISIPELDYGFAGWTGAAAAAPQFWAPSGLNEFAVYPPPASGIFLLEGFTEAPWLSAPGDFIDIGDEDLTRVLDYAHHFLTFKEAGQELDATQSLFQGFVTAAGARNSRLRASTFYRRWAGLDRAAEERPDSISTPPGAHLMKLNIVDVENGHHPITGQYVKGRAVYAFYACGHCSGQQLHEDLKTTPEYWCSHCSRYLCKRPLCHSRCTPLYDLAKDRFESTGAHGLLVPAIMAGATTPEQAIALGFPKETFNG